MLRRLQTVMIASALAFVCLPARADGVSRETLRPTSVDPVTSLCTADGAWCLGTTMAEGEGNAAEASVLHNARIVATIPLGNSSIETAEMGLWSSVIHLPNDIHVFGILATERQMYSGDGGSATRLKLYEVAGKTNGSRAVIELPYEASIMIRACFFEEDNAARLDACHDEYSFRSDLKIDRDAGAQVRFLYTSHARTYPGARSRGADSRSGPPLSKHDLKWVENTACSTTRVITRDAKTGTWTLDRPLPDCPDFLEP